MSRVRANHSFAWGTDNGDRMVNGGEEFDRNDELVQATPADWWDEVPAPADKPKAPVKRGTRRA